MRLPFAYMNGVKTKAPSKGSNSLNAGIDFYVPESGSKLDFNPGLKDKMVPYFPGENGPIYTRHDEILDIANPDMKLLDSENIVKRFKIKDDGSKVYYLYPRENVRIHSGIATEVDFGQFELVCNRSGIASNTSCVVGAHLIDCGYANELIFDIHNIGLIPLEIEPGMKITQILVGQYISCTPFELPYDRLYEDLRKIEFRGLKGMGSSGNK